MKDKPTTLEELLDSVGLLASVALALGALLAECVPLIVIGLMGMKFYADRLERLAGGME